MEKLISSMSVLGNVFLAAPDRGSQRAIVFAQGLLVDAQGRPTITYGYFPGVRFHWLEFLDPLRFLPGKWFRERVVHTPDRSEPTTRVEYVLGACFLIPRAALEGVGPLDDRFFMYFEETDWCLRARGMGLDIWYCADVEIAH